jgi:hypothetical protein
MCVVVFFQIVVWNGKNDMKSRHENDNSHYESGRGLFHYNLIKYVQDLLLLWIEMRLRSLIWSAQSMMSFDDCRWNSIQPNYRNHDEIDDWFGKSVNFVQYKRVTSLVSSERITLTGAHAFPANSWSSCVRSSLTPWFQVIFQWSRFMYKINNRTLLRWTWKILFGEFWVPSCIPVSNVIHFADVDSCKDDDSGSYEVSIRETLSKEVPLLPIVSFVV